jgi:Mg-chelatase subunit ChlD
MSSSGKRRGCSRFGAMAMACAVLSMIGCSAGSAGAPPGSSGAGGSGAASGGAPDFGSGGMTDFGSGGAATAAGGEAAFIAPPVEVSRSCGDKAIDILFVVDRSGSMNCNLPPLTDSKTCESTATRADPNQPSKWEVITSTLSTAFDKLIPKDDTVKIRAGLSYFSSDDRCGARSAPTIPLADVTQPQVELLRGSLKKQTPAGATPIVGATVLAYKELYTQSAPGTAAHVILLTDGADSCGSDYDKMVGPGDHVADLLGVQAPDAAKVGIKTWVIGAPGSEGARNMLSHLAVAGGTRSSDSCNPGDAGNPESGSCHYDMTTGDFQTALETALEHIVAVVTCQIK